MIIFPMRNGIRMITVKEKPSSKRNRCADAAIDLHMVMGWSQRALRGYSVQGLIDAARVVI